MRDAIHRYASDYIYVTVGLGTGGRDIYRHRCDVCLEESYGYSDRESAYSALRTHSLRHHPLRALVRVFAPANVRAQHTA